MERCSFQFVKYIYYVCGFFLQSLRRLIGVSFYGRSPLKCFVDKYFIYLHSKAKNQRETWGVSVHLIDKWRNKVDLSAL